MLFFMKLLSATQQCYTIEAASLTFVSGSLGTLYGAFLGSKIGHNLGQMDYDYRKKHICSSMLRKTGGNDKDRIIKNWVKWITLTGGVVGAGVGLCFLCGINYLKIYYDI